MLLQDLLGLEQEVPQRLRRDGDPLDDRQRSRLPLQPGQQRHHAMGQRPQELDPRFVERLLTDQQR